MMRTMAAPDHSVPSASVLAAFGAVGEARALPGGRGLSILVGGLVLKPHEPAARAEARWSADVVEHLTDRAPDFRVARPVRAGDGGWLADGWSAAEVLDGEPRGVGAADWPALFAAARAYNRALIGFARPDFLEARTHRWALADRVAFGECEYPDPVAQSGLLLEALLRQRRETHEPGQVVHGDLCGNVLFAEGRPPAVIDFSPYHRPVGFSLAVAAVDALLWYDAPLSVLELAAEGAGPDYSDHLVRALIFRLVAHNEAVKESRQNGGPVDAEMDRFDLVYDAVKRFQHGPLGSRGDRAFDAVLCDVDGVLRHWPGDAALEQAHGLAPGVFAATAFAPHRLLPAITGEVTDEQWRASIAAGLVDDGHCATPAQARSVVAQWTSKRGRLDEDVLALLQLAREIVPVALVSNASNRLEADLIDLGLADFVDHVVNTSRLGFAKPDPRVYEHAARFVGVPVERCLFVDDSWENVEAARDAGMSVVHFRESVDLEDALRPLFPLARPVRQA